ncbi:hypothetical protein CVU83_01385, partial [Candidatus Falkowbacteria bacterium HGW-Falkowbacteria-2]
MELKTQKINRLVKGSAKAISRIIVFNPFKKGLLSRESLRTRADKNLVYSLAPTTIPRREQLKHLAKLLDPREKMVLKISTLLLLISISFLGYRFYSNNLLLFPKVGGTYSEGVVGYPQSINPL